MQIKITTTFDISEENKPLIEVVSKRIGYDQWCQVKREQALRVELEANPDFLEEDLVIDLSTEEFVKQFLTADATSRLCGLIAPSIDEYFGIAMKATADVVKSQLDEAIVTTVEITDSIIDEPIV